MRCQAWECGLEGESDWERGTLHWEPHLTFAATFTPLHFVEVGECETVRLEEVMYPRVSHASTVVSMTIE